MGKVERWGSEFSGKHRCILFLLSLFHPVVLFSSPLTVVAPSSPLLLPFFPSFLFFFSFFFFFFCIVPLPSPAPSTSVGVNLSPRLSPNPELYKLKPISLPGLRSSYSKPLYFRLFVVGKHARSSSRRSARTRCLATTLHLLLVHPHTRTLSPSLSLSLSRSSCVLIRTHAHAPTNLCSNFAHAYPRTRTASSLLCTTVYGCGSLIRPCERTHSTLVHARIFTRLSVVRKSLVHNVRERDPADILTMKRNLRFPSASLPRFVEI